MENKNIMPSPTEWQMGKPYSTISVPSRNRITTLRSAFTVIRSISTCRVMASGAVIVSGSFFSWRRKLFSPARRLSFP